MYFNIRLLELIDYLKENPTSFGDKLESTSGENIRLITKNEKANPGLNILSEILNKYPQVNARWLLIGEGDMIIKPETEEPILKTAEEIVKMDMVSESYGKCKSCAEKDEHIAHLNRAISIIERLLPQTETKKEIESKVS